LVRAQAIALIPNNDYDSYYPEVVVSYATGRRSNDAEGTGPGMYYANQLMMFLYGFGIQCFSGLHVPSSKDWKTFMKRLEVLIIAFPSLIQQNHVISYIRITILTISRYIYAYIYVYLLTIVFKIKNIYTI